MACKIFTAYRKERKTHTWKDRVLRGEVHGVPVINI
jgi:hypothetical protein